MAVRDMFPETINEGYRVLASLRTFWCSERFGWDAVPRQGDEFEVPNFPHVTWENGSGSPGNRTLNLRIKSLNPTFLTRLLTVTGKCVYAGERHVLESTFLTVPDPS